MNNKNGHFDSLLKTLAQQGDPSAFLSLAGDYLKARYQKERENGTAHPEARSKVLAEATELFEQLQSIPPKHRDAWFEEHCKISSGQESDEAVMLDKNTMRESKLFIDECTHELLRTGSQLKKKYTRKLRSLPYLIAKNPVALTLLIIAGIIGLGIGAGFFLKSTNQKIVVTLVSADDQKSITFPFSSDKDEHADTVTTAISADTVKKTSADTASVKDSAVVQAEKPVSPAVPLVKKPYIPPLAAPRPLPATPRPASAYTTTPAQSAAQPSTYYQQPSATTPSAAPVTKTEVESPVPQVESPAPAPAAVPAAPEETEY